MKDRIGIVALVICGIACLGLFTSLIARLGSVLIRICGVVLLISLAVTVYRFVRDRIG